MKVSRCSAFLLAAIGASTWATPSADASPVQTLYQGVIGNQLATSSPGTAINLDYRPQLSALPTHPQTPYEALGMSVLFDCSGTPSSVHLQLSTGPVYPIPLSGSQGLFTWYDPQHFDPATIEPAHAEITQAWRDEMSDGVLNATLWAPGTSINGAPKYFVLSGGLSVITPEPGGALTAVATSALLGRRRRAAAAAGKRRGI